MKNILYFFGSIISAVVVVVHGVNSDTDIRDTARRLSKDPDALFEMYQTYKDVRGSNMLSPLENLLDQILQRAEDQRSNANSSPKHILTILTDHLLLFPFTTIHREA